LTDEIISGCTGFRANTLCHVNAIDSGVAGGGGGGICAASLGGRVQGAEKLRAK